MPRRPPAVVQSLPPRARRPASAARGPRWLLLGSVCWLAACVTTGGGSPAESGGGGAAGSPASARPAAGTGTPAPTARSGEQVQRIQRGRSRIALSSQELDRYCKDIAPPFEVEGNVRRLGQLIAAEAPTLLRIGSVRQAAGESRALTRHLRDEAVRMNWMPMALEVRYGEQVHKRFEASGDLIGRDERPELYERLERAFERVTSGIDVDHPYRFRLYLRDRDEGNATAMAGGAIYVDAGLLKRGADPAYLNFALAHEVGHLLQRHETRILQARVIDTILVGLDASTVLAAITNPERLVSGALQTIAQGHGLFAKHYGDQELVSDACGVRLLDNAFDGGPEVLAAADAFARRLPPAPAKAAPPRRAGAPQANLEGVGEVIEVVSKPIDRHPSSAERIENLRAILGAINAGRRSQGRQPLPAPGPGSGGTGPR